MGAIVSEVLIILALLVLNGLFAMSELAIVSAKRVRLEHRAESGDAGARAALALATDSASFLSTVQVGITLVSVIASVFGGATIAAILKDAFVDAGWRTEHAEVVSLVIVVAGITFLSLIIGELVPKRIALANPERVAAIVARPMRVVSSAARPLVAFLTWTSNLVLRLVGLQGRTEPGLTEEEIHALVEQGAEAGVVPPAEHEMLEGVFRLGDQQVASIMVPRPDVDWVDVDADRAELREALTGRGRSFLLVCEGSIERVVGVANIDDVLSQCLDRQEIDLRAVVARPVFVPAAIPVLRLLEILREARQRVAIALDEYGGVQGVVALEDVLEEIVGQLPTREDDVPSLVATGTGEWMADGGTRAEEIEEALDVAPLDIAGDRGFRTLGGFMMTQLGRVPQCGDVVEHDGYRFEVARMNGRRVERVRVTRTEGRER